MATTHEREISILYYSMEDLAVRGNHKLDGDCVRQGNISL